VDEEASFRVPSPPPVIQEEKRKSQASVLEDLKAACLDKIQPAGDLERQLADKLVCRNKDYTNQDNFLLTRLGEPKQRYAATTPLHKA
jgi:hypothetical protein